LIVSETVAATIAAPLLPALALLYTGMGRARAQADEIEQAMPSAVAVTRRAQRRRAREIGRRYTAWAAVAALITIAAGVPAVAVVSELDRDAPISWQRCLLIAVTAVWLIVAISISTHARRLHNATWLAD
jgi:putative copper export protein